MAAGSQAASRNLARHPDPAKIQLKAPLDGRIECADPEDVPLRPKFQGHLGDRGACFPEHRYLQCQPSTSPVSAIKPNPARGTRELILDRRELKKSYRQSRGCY